MNGWIINDADAWGSVTQNAGTIITRLVTPRKGLFTNLVSVLYTAAATAHTLTIMRPFNWTTFSAAAAASQAVVNLTSDPGLYATAGNLRDRPDSATPSVADNGIAANDFVAYEAADGTWVMDTVSSVSSLAVTLTTNLPTGGVLKGGRFWFFGIITNSNPHTGVAHATMTLPASVTTTYAPGSLVPVIRSTHQYHPMILHSGNATNAGTLVSAAAIYTKN